MENIISAMSNVNSLADVGDLMKDTTKTMVYNQTPLEKDLAEATSNANWNVGNTVK